MKTKLSIIAVLFVLSCSISACYDDEIGPKDKIKDHQTIEFDGIPESDAHTNPLEY